MANRLRICIVGGRSFGKTALVKSVCHIPCFIPLNNKGEIQRLQDMSYDDPAWEQTRWNDVKDCKFSFTVEQEGRKKPKTKILSFADYPGEYFEQDYDGVPSKGKLMNGEAPTNESTGQKILRKLDNIRSKLKIGSLFYSPDGIIILLPLDFGEKNSNGTNLYNQGIYEKRVLEYIEKVRPGTPIQIAISKCDKYDKNKDMSEAEILTAPPFATFFKRFQDCYRNHYGKEYDAGVISISIKDRDSDGNWRSLGDDHFNESYNVCKLFTRMSQIADVARSERLKADWANAKWWKRMFVIPWTSLDVRRKNSTNRVINRIFIASWLRFLGFVSVFCAAVAISIVATLSASEISRLNGIDAEIRSARNHLPDVTLGKLANIDAQLAESRWVQPLFFIPRLKTLKNAETSLKNEYIRYLEDDLRNRLSDARVKDMDSWEVSPEDRQARAKSRQGIIKEQIARIPEGLTSDSIRNSQIECEKLIKILDEDLAFDNELYALRELKGGERLRQLDNVRQKYNTKRESRKVDFERLEAEIAKTENELSDELSGKLAGIDSTNLSDGWEAQVARDEKKIEIISNDLERVFVPGSEKYKTWDEQLAKTKAHKSNVSHYGPFDKAYAELNANDLKAISSFLSAWPSDNYPLRNEDYEKISQAERAMLDAIKAEVDNVETSNSDDADELMKTRIARKQKRIDAYASAMAKLPEGSETSSSLDEKAKDAKKWIADHEKYLAFDEEFSQANSEPEEKRAKALDMALKKFTKADYPEYAERWDREGEKANSLSAKFANECILRVNDLRQKISEGPWERHVELANERIAVIDGALSRVLDHDSLKLKNMIAAEKEYIVKTTQAGVAAQVEQGERDFADIADKSMKARIGLAQERIKAYANALANLQESSDLRTEVNGKINATQKWIADHEKYVAFDEGLSQANNEPEEKRVMALDEFLKKFAKEDYPEYAAKWDAEWENANGLSAKLAGECADRISELREKYNAGSWETRANAAANRIGMVKSTLPLVLEKDKPALLELIRQDNEEIDDLRRNGHFDDAFTKVKQTPKTRIIAEIMSFREQYKAADYQDKADAYQELDRLESSVLNDVNKELKDEIGKIPEAEASNFTARLERNYKLLAAYESALKAIPEGHPASEKYKKNRDNLNIDVDRLRKWSKIQKAAKRLSDLAEEAESLSAEEQLRNEKIIINNVGAFYRDYPEKNNVDVELTQTYETVKSILANAENSLLKDFQAQYDSYASDRVATGSDEEIKSINERLKLIDDYKTVFLKDTIPYDSLLKLRDELRGKLTEKQKEKEFKDSYSECDRFVKDGTKTAAEKIGQIERFVDTYKVDSYRPEVKDAITYFENEKSRLAIQDKFDGLVREKDNLFKTFPSEGDMDPRKLSQYKRQCLELKEKFNALKREKLIETRVAKTIGEIDEQIKKVNNSLGDGTWSDIKQKLQAYKDNPTEVKYKEVMAAIKGFDSTKEENHSYEEKVDDLKRYLEKDWSAAVKVDEAWEKFQKDPHEQSFIKFKLAYSECQPKTAEEKKEGIWASRDRKVSKYKTLIEIAPTELHPTIELISISFTSSPFARYGYSSEISIKTKPSHTKDKAKVFLEADSVPNEWKKGGSRKIPAKKGGFETDQITITNVGIKFELRNYSGPNTSGEGRLSYWEILAKGANNNGIADLPVQIRMNNESKPATLTFRFSRLPSCE